MEKDVTVNNYQMLAQSTEAPVTAELQKRIFDSIALINYKMIDFYALCKDIDDIKKYVFYNKGCLEDMPEDFRFTEQQIRVLLEPESIRLLHCIFGLATETGELFEQIHGNIFQNKFLDMVNIKEELGDLSWYQALGLNVIDVPMIEMLQINIDKLRLRYPEKFTEYHANNRDLESERNLLEE